MMSKLALVTAFVFVLAGCHPGQSVKSDSPQLIVAAAANLTEVCPQLGEQFTNKTGISVIFTYGATGDLSRQIENGAPFDVFAAADSEHIEALDRKGLLTTGSAMLYARGRLVMWLPPNAPKIDRIEQITERSFERIAIAKPDVAPYGKATVESLEALRIWKEVEPKVVYGQSVSQTKQFAATGNAEVAFIPLALIKQNEGSYLEVDSSLHAPINQSLGILKTSSQQEASRKFVDFLLSAEGQDAFVKKGYLSVLTR